MEVPKKKVVRSRVSFDEEVIAEHDKERGTRMKIEEPKTPYRAGFEDSDEETDKAVSMEDAMKKLNDLAKKREFEERRKHHYNEGMNMKSVLKKPVVDDDDDDDE